jgi:alginate O-acetyltransferase complex protein AlgI
VLQFLPLPIVWLIFYLLGRVPYRTSLSPRRYVAAVASLVLLLGVAGVRTMVFYTVLGLGIILVGLWLRTARESTLRKIIFVISLAGVVVMIAVFLKYRIYFQKYFTSVPSLSYLGFRGIAYLVSGYSHRRVDFSSGLMQMFFLPMLFMGPISRVENFQDQQRDYGEALRRLAFAFPMLIAGHLTGLYVLEKILWLTDVPWWQYWLGAIANSFEFYFTFAGYTHLIIALGLLAGFKLPENFNNPYMSTSISDFWRRWHMSLSFWIRDYLYIPLGGNRKGLARKCANLMIAMGICGIWHGLELHFLLWGLFHGALMAMESIMSHYRWQPLKRHLGRGYVPIKIAINFSLVTFAWLLFKYSMPEVLVYLRSMIAW